jgi:hypothetical protein
LSSARRLRHRNGQILTNLMIPPHTVSALDQLRDEIDMLASRCLTAGTDAERSQILVTAGILVAEYERWIRKAHLLSTDLECTVQDSGGVRE